MKRKAVKILVGCLAAIVAIVLLTGFYRVDQGEEALVLTLGRVTDVKEPGLYWRVPFVQQVLSESVTTIHTKEYGFRTAKQGSIGRAATYNDVTDEGVMLTGDNSIVSLEAVYQYTIKDVKQYMFDVDDPEGTLQLAFEAVIRRNIQNRTLDDALLNKDEIEQEVLPDFQALIDSYQMGVKINDVRIQNISVPQEVAAAYEDVNNAKNEKTKRLDEAEKYKNNVLPVARSNAYRTIQDAEAYRAETVANAQADVAIFNAIYEKYKANPEVTKTRLMIEALEEILTHADKLYIVDDNGETTKLIDLSEIPVSSSGAVAAMGGN